MIGYLNYDSCFRPTQSNFWNKLNFNVIKKNRFQRCIVLWDDIARFKQCIISEYIFMFVLLLTQIHKVCLTILNDTCHIYGDSHSHMYWMLQRIPVLNIKYRKLQKSMGCLNNENEILVNDPNIYGVTDNSMLNLALEEAIFEMKKGGFKNG